MARELQVSTIGARLLIMDKASLALTDREIRIQLENPLQSLGRRHFHSMLFSHHVDSFQIWIIVCSKTGSQKETKGHERHTITAEVVSMMVGLCCVIAPSLLERITRRTGVPDLGYPRGKAIPQAWSPGFQVKSWGGQFHWDHSQNHCAGALPWDSEEF